MAALQNHDQTFTVSYELIELRKCTKLFFKRKCTERLQKNFKIFLKFLKFIHQLPKIAIDFAEFFADYGQRPRMYEYTVEVLTVVFYRLSLKK